MISFYCTTTMEIDLWAIGQFLESASIDQNTAILHPHEKTIEATTLYLATPIPCACLAVAAQF